MIAHDTNIWLYVYDARDPVKQQRARELVNEPEPFVLLWQVGCEFIAASRKLTPAGFSSDDAWEALDRIQQASATVCAPKPEVWSQARALQRSHSVSFWDALVVAACLEAGVTKLYSEDLSPGQFVPGLTIVNPFASN